MKLYLTDQTWTTDYNVGVIWGKHSKQIPVTDREYAYHIPIADTTIIKPLVGIITTEHKSRKFAGNRAAFQRIQLALQQTGGLSYVFTPSGWGKESIIGFVYDFLNDKWNQAEFPLPDVIYNRIPFRKHELEGNIQIIKDVCQAQDIPFFNESFLSKEDTFKWLSRNDSLHSYLPYTKYLGNLADFEQMIQRFPQIYLKPSRGKKGKGIIVIEHKANNNWDVKTVNSSSSNLNKEQVLAQWITPHLGKDYLIQEAIKPLKWNGSRFDYRVLVHRKNRDEFMVSGIGVRQSQHQEVTTHVPAGGKIIPFIELPFQEDQNEIKFIAQEIGQTLANHLVIGEFSIDMGKNDEGKLFIFEVNSKPMVFDEDEIRAKGLSHLLSYFRFLSKQVNK